MNKFENVYQDAALMRKVLLGEANEVEQQDLEKRLAECPDLQKVYGQLQNGETLRVAFGEYQNYSSKKAYQSFLQSRKYRSVVLSGFGGGLLRLSLL